MTDTRGGARRGAGRPEGGPAGRSADPYRVPLSRDRMAEVRAYADAHGLKIAAAVDVALTDFLAKWRAHSLVGMDTQPEPLVWCEYGFSQHDGEHVQTPDCVHPHLTGRYAP
jgi:hypothetical protein